jgi:hypothetical protein
VNISTLTGKEIEITDVDGVAHIRNKPKGNDMAGGYYHKNTVLSLQPDLNQIVYDGDKYVFHEDVSVEITEKVRDLVYHVVHLGGSGDPDTDLNPKPIRNEDKTLFEEDWGMEYVTLHEKEKTH